jgi:hypothetical protein
LAARIQPLAYWSRWKAAALASVAAALAIIPNLPGFSRGLRYTAFYFTPVGAPIRVLSSVILGLTGLTLILLAIIYNIHRLAVWIEEDNLSWRAVTVKKLHLTNVKAVALTATGNIRIERADGGKAVEIPASLMRSRSDIQKVLSVLKT